MGESGGDLLLLGGLLLAALVTGLFALWLACWLLWFAFAGAIVMLSAAANQGFVGLVAFVAALVFLFPVMVPIAIVVGFLASRADSKEQREKAKLQREAVRWRHKYLGEPMPAKKTKKPLTESPPADPQDRYKWANRLPPYDDPPPDGLEERQKWSNRLPPYDE